MKRMLCLSFTLMLLLSACTHAPTETPTDDIDSTALRVAVLPTVECLPFYVADEYGIFDSLDVNVRLLTFEAAMDADTAFQHQDADVLVSDLVKACLWRSQGQPVRIVAGNALNLHLVTTKSARIKALKSVKEKIVAITRHSAVDFTADRLLASVKLNSEELNKPQINNIALRTSMTNQQQYDGAILPEPYASSCVMHGANRIGSSEQVGCAAQMLAVIVTDSIQTKRRTDIDNLLKAYDLAVDIINQNAQTSAPQLLTLLPQAPTLPDSIATLPSFQHAALPADSTIQRVKTWLRGRDIFGKDFATSDLLIP